MKAEELAQKLADHFRPPYVMSKRKRLPHAELMRLKSEDRYEDEEIRATPDSSTMIVFRASDGHPSLRSLTYLEIVEAMLKLQEEENNGAKNS